MGGRGDQVGGQDRQGGEEGEKEEEESEMQEMQEKLDKGGRGVHLGYSNFRKYAHPSFLP